MGLFLEGRGSGARPTPTPSPQVARRGIRKQNYITPQIFL